jgi:hypothetical protein
MDHSLLIEVEDVVEETTDYEIVDKIPPWLRWARRKLQSPLFQKLTVEDDLGVIRVYRYDDRNS